MRVFVVSRASLVLGVFLACASVYWFVKFSRVVPIVSVGLLGACALLAIFARRRLDRSSVRFAIALFVLNLAWLMGSFFFDPVRLGPSEIAKSALQNAFYILLGPLFASMLPHLNRGQGVIRASTIVIAATLGLCLVERAGLLNFDAVRYALFSDHLLYENDSRDKALVGFVRPMLIASEPSLVASWIAVLATVSRCYGASRWTVVMIAIATWLVIGSPYALLMLLVAAVPGAPRSSAISRSLPVVGGAVLLAYIALISIVVVSDGELPIRDQSDYRRLILPVQLAVDAIRENALIGFGMGSWDRIATEGGIVSSGVFMPFVALHQGGVLGLLMMMVIVRRYVGCLGLLHGACILLVLSVILGNIYGSALFYIIVLERLLRIAVETRCGYGASVLVKTERLEAPLGGSPRVVA